MINLAINGFGRIGRQAFKAALANKKIKVVAINDLAEPRTLAHLFKYDTVYGTYPGNISFDEKNIIVDGVKIPVFAEKDPSLLPWGKFKVQVALECTGRFTQRADLEKHLSAGAKKVILSAPSKGDGVPTYVLGANGHLAGEESSAAINMGSCTTNCISPAMTVLEESFGIEKAFMTTVHSFTVEQNLQDGPPPGLKQGDLRRARAATHNIVPSPTGAAKSVAEAITSLKGSFDGLAFRVPTITGSVADITAVLKKNVTKDQVNNAFIKASKAKKFAGILAVTNEPLVSSDFIGNTHSSIVDLLLTNVVGGNLVKVISWYDNEVGYAHRLIEMAEKYA